MAKHFFLKSEAFGRGTRLVALEGQELRRGVRLNPQVTVTGCESVRKRHPLGTVFHSPAVRCRGSAYATDTLTPIADPQGRPLPGNIFDAQLYDIYRTFTERQTLNKD